MKKSEVIKIIKDWFVNSTSVTTLADAILALHEKEIKEVLEIKGKPAKTLSYYEQGYNACLKEVKSKLKGGE